MKITDPGVIRNGEKDLIESLREDIDLDAVREIIKKKMTTAALSPKGGEIVVHNNQIAFRMDFELCLSGSLMFDRQGNHIPTESDGHDEPAEDPKENEEVDLFDMDEKMETEGDLDLPDYDLEPLDDMENLTEAPDPETDTMDDLADDDITDILKESRDFWEKKKE